MRLLYQKIPSVEMSAATKVCEKRLPEKRGRVRGAIRTEETADNSLIDGGANSDTHC